MSADVRLGPALGIAFSLGWWGGWWFARRRRRRTWAREAQTEMYAAVVLELLEVSYKRHGLEPPTWLLELLDNARRVRRLRLER